MLFLWRLPAVAGGVRLEIKKMRKVPGFVVRKLHEVEVSV